jgi:hypothetical protein
VLISLTDSEKRCLKEYRSSEHVVRRFCKKCGQTVFYTNDVAGKGVLWDVARETLCVSGDESQWLVGLYREENSDGSEIDRDIEGWMLGRCSFEEEGWEFVGKTVVGAAAEEWRKRWTRTVLCDLRFGR